MTETFGPYAGFPLDTDLPPAKQGSCGLPFADVEARVADAEDGSLLAAGEQGVIELRGPNMMRGICGRTRPDTFRPDGFYSTGDLGTLDADGYLFYAGRADDMFKVSGATVYPTEVEASLRAIDFVRQAYVTDIEGPGGAAVVGAMVLVGDGCSIAEVDAAARQAMSSFKVPRTWVLATSADEVPMLATGKVDKAGLQALIAARGRAGLR